MEKNMGFATAPPSENFPAHPPTYNEAVFQQPAYNPQYAASPVVQTPYAQPIQHQQQMVAIPVQQAPTVVISIGPQPATITCPQCHKTITTRTRTEANKSAHIAALVLCLLACYCCCCIPYCMSSFRNVHHTCPQCKAFIGTYRP